MYTLYYIEIMYRSPPTIYGCYTLDSMDTTFRSLCMLYISYIDMTLGSQPCVWFRFLQHVCGDSNVGEVWVKLPSLDWEEHRCAGLT